MTISSPKISVIIPVYNTANYLSDCFDSVLEQSVSNIEIIVIDDGFTDGCWDIIREYAARHSQLRVFKQNHKRQGLRITWV